MIGIAEILGFGKSYFYWAVVRSLQKLSRKDFQVFLINS